MLSDPHRKEALSRAYIQAVAGHCGLSRSFYDFDYGMDVTLNEITRRRNRYVVSGFRIDIQAKCTAEATIEGDSIVYAMEKKHMTTCGKRTSVARESSSCSSCTRKRTNGYRAIMNV